MIILHFVKGQITSFLIGAVEPVVFHPQTPQGGFFNLLFFSKSPLGDLGVKNKRGTFSSLDRIRGFKLRN